MNSKGKDEQADLGFHCLPGPKGTIFHVRLICSASLVKISEDSSGRYLSYFSYKTEFGISSLGKVRKKIQVIACWKVLQASSFHCSKSTETLLWKLSLFGYLIVYWWSVAVVVICSFKKEGVAALKHLPLLHFSVVYTFLFWGSQRTFGFLLLQSYLKIECCSTMEDWAVLYITFLFINRLNQSCQSSLTVPSEEKKTSVLKNSDV